MDLYEAQNLFFGILEEITKSIPAMRSCNLDDKEAERQLFSDELAPIITSIEKLSSDFLQYDDLHLVLDDVDVEDYGLEIVAFCVLSEDIQLWEIFEDPDDFVNALLEIPSMQLVVDELISDNSNIINGATLKNPMGVLYLSNIKKRREHRQLLQCWCFFFYM